MGKKTEALLEQVADVIVQVTQECVNTAATGFNLEVDNADYVVIDGLTVDSTVETSTRRCEKREDIDIGRIQSGVGDRLDQVVKAADGMRGDEVQFKAKIKESITVKAATTCTAIALASTSLRFANTQGKVVIQNVKVNQVARAQIAKCISNVQAVS